MLIDGINSGTIDYVDGSVEAADMASGVIPVVPGKNKIINGNFDIWQRGTSQTSHGYGSDDRWSNYMSGSTKTHSQQAFVVGQTDVPNNPEYYSRTVVTSSAGAANIIAKQQNVEDVRLSSGKTFTLSFWAKADSAKNIATEFAQAFGNGGSPSTWVNGIGVTTHALTTSWQKFTATGTLPSISGKTLGTSDGGFFRTTFFFDAGSNHDARTNSLGQQSGTFDIAQVQLEEGSVATEFEQRTIGEELSLCQRYYEKSYDQDTVPGSTFSSNLGILIGTGATLDAVGINFQTAKRGASTVISYNSTTGTTGQARNIASGGSVAVNVIGIGEGGFRVTSTASVDNTINGFNWTADAEL